MNWASLRLAAKKKEKLASRQAAKTPRKKGRFT
jgi:hypothetical protein